MREEPSQNEPLWAAFKDPIMIPLITKIPGWSIEEAPTTQSGCAVDPAKSDPNNETQHGEIFV
jgi:hypothetical protein